MGEEISTQKESDNSDCEDPEEEAINKDELMMTRNEALQAAEDIAKFALHHGDEELANYISPAVDHLHQLKLCRLKQSNITSYFA